MNEAIAIDPLKQTSTVMDIHFVLCIHLDRLNEAKVDKISDCDRNTVLKARYYFKRGNLLTPKKLMEDLCAKSTTPDECHTEKMQYEQEYERWEKRPWYEVLGWTADQILTCTDLNQIKKEARNKTITAHPDRLNRLENDPCMQEWNMEMAKLIGGASSVPRQAKQLDDIQQPIREAREQQQGNTTPAQHGNGTAQYGARPFDQ